MTKSPSWNICDLTFSSNDSLNVTTLIQWLVEFVIGFLPIQSTSKTFCINILPLAIDVILSYQKSLPHIQCYLSIPCHMQV
jgi:hypothetical protein